MKALIEVRPTPEQLALFSRIQSGVEIIRGAAGSGKTTTALLKLRAAVGFYLNRMKRAKSAEPVRVLVLTFNRTLRGYVGALAERQFEPGEKIELEISTFSSWAKRLLNAQNVMDIDQAKSTLETYADAIELPPEFVIEEAQYVMGRFLPVNLQEYLTARRDGRGSMPRMDRAARESILRDVIAPYAELKNRTGQLDWNDLAVSLSGQRLASYDVVVIDEAQDFSANELRAVLRQLSDAHTVTIVLDTTQRIYARSGFTWAEIGLSVRPENSFTLQKNYRNTKQIAKFAAAILSGISADVDGTMPNFNEATREGPLPVVLQGRFSHQMQYALRHILTAVDLELESVAFLHPKGWFGLVRTELDAAGLPYVLITRQPEWPTGPENIALSTMHSAKGLEFDHVIIIGLNAEVVPVDGDDPTDIESEPLVRLRKLVAMAVGRARKQVIIGYKADDAPLVAEFFDESLCERVDV